MGEYKMIGFDLEIAENLPEDGNIDWSVPLGVTCAGLATNAIQSWVAPDMEGLGYAPKIADMTGLVERLERYGLQGFRIVTWNGMGFDFRVMAQETGEDVGLYDRICDLAWEHIDIAFQMRVEKGYMIGLDAAAKGLGDRAGPYREEVMTNEAHDPSGPVRHQARRLAAAPDRARGRRGAGRRRRAGLPGRGNRAGPGTT